MLKRKKLGELVEKIKTERQIFSEYESKEVSIFCRDEFHLSGRLYIAENGEGNKSVILCHDCKSSGENDFGAAFRMYRGMNFNILVIDQRAHGESEGKYSSMGIAESFDIVSWCQWLEMCFGTERDIIVHGVSMGAYAAVISGANPEMPQNVKCIIADGVYPHVYSLISKRVQKSFSFLAKPAIAFINFFYKNHVGFDMRDFSLFTVAKSVRIPVLFIHSQNDSEAAFSDMESISKRVPVRTDILRIKKAPHRTCFIKEESYCAEAVKKFIGEL